MSPLIETALAEGITQLSLAFFTTATPGGIVACLIVACYVLVRPTDDDRSVYLRRFLIIPLAAVILGLIASTNHLGRPSNTLYVLMGVGRSPLSNEVAAVVAFTGLLWIAWLLSFARTRFRKAVKVLLGLSVLMGAWSLSRIAGAYSIDTVVTWNLPYTAANLVLASLVSGPVLALVAFCAAGIRDNRLYGIFLGGSAVFSLALAVLEFMQYGALQDLQGGLYGASDLVPFYPACIIASTVLIGSGAISGALPVIRGRQAGVGPLVAGSLLIFGGVFIVRFVFYCMRLTAGL